MKLFKEHELSIEAQENTSPTIAVPMNIPYISKGCSCTEVIAPTDYIVKVDKLLPVAYMSNSDHYIKTVNFSVNDEQVTIKIKVIE